MGRRDSTEARCVIDEAACHHEFGHTLAHVGEQPCTPEVLQFLAPARIILSFESCLLLVSVLLVFVERGLLDEQVAQDSTRATVLSSISRGTSDTCVLCSILCSLFLFSHNFLLCFSLSVKPSRHIAKVILDITNLILYRLPPSSTSRTTSFSHSLPPSRREKRAQRSLPFFSSTLHSFHTVEAKARRSLVPKTSNQEVGRVRDDGRWRTTHLWVRQRAGVVLQ